MQRRPATTNLLHWPRTSFCHNSWFEGLIWTAIQLPDGACTGATGEDEGIATCVWGESAFGAAAVTGAAVEGVVLGGWMGDAFAAAAGPVAAVGDCVFCIWLEGPLVDAAPGATFGGALFFVCSPKKRGIVALLLTVESSKLQTTALQGRLLLES